MQKKRGFTLVELLVVISIIAMLLSILMPALGKVRKQTKKLICRTNLHQWSVAWNAYVNDSRGKLPTGYTGGYVTETYWNKAIKPYFSNNMKIAMCPEVKGFQYENGSATGIPMTWSAWGKFEMDGGKDLPYVFKDDFGSYGINDWVEAHPTSKNHWRNVNVRLTSQIPFIFECFWPFSMPNDTDPPPQYDGEFGTGGWGEMKRFVVNRHNGETMGMFLDLSARPVGLKELWTLKWSQNFKTSNRYTQPNYVWPKWMQGFRNYYESKK